MCDVSIYDKACSNEQHDVATFSNQLDGVRISCPQQRIAARICASGRTNEITSIQVLQNPCITRRKQTQSGVSTAVVGWRCESNGRMLNHYTHLKLPQYVAITVELDHCGFVGVCRFATVSCQHDGSILIYICSPEILVCRRSVLSTSDVVTHRHAACGHVKRGGSLRGKYDRAVLNVVLRQRIVSLEDHIEILRSLRLG